LIQEFRLHDEDRALFGIVQTVLIVHKYLPVIFWFEKGQLLSEPQEGTSRVFTLAPAPRVPDSKLTSSGLNSATTAAAHFRGIYHRPEVCRQAK
jgi:hypothetical protein